MTKLVHVNGYSVRADFGDSEPRIHDLELGRRLGFGRPRKIRELIKRHMDAGHVGEPGVRPTVGHVRGNVATEYWLDEEAAIFIASQSGTTNGIAITKEVIKVFVMVRRGELTPASSSLPPFLTAHASTWEDTFGDLQRSLWRLYGNGSPFPTRSPRELWGPNAMIWRDVIGTEAYAALRALNPSPHKGKNHHQHMKEDAREAFKNQLLVIKAVADMSRDPADFRERIKFLYRGRPLQLPLVEQRRGKAA